MSINTRQLRQHYASLSDEELEALDPNDLTDAAHSCYDSEMKLRGLSPAGPNLDDAEGGEHPEPLEADGDAHQDDGGSFVASTFVDIPGSSSVADTEDAYRALSDAGIPCRVKVQEPEPDPPNGVYYPERQIIVPGSLALRATSILDKAIYNPKQESEWKTHLESLTDDQLRRITVDDICAGLLDRAERLRTAYLAERRRREL